MRLSQQKALLRSRTRPAGPDASTFSSRTVVKPVRTDPGRAGQRPLATRAPAFPGSVRSGRDLYAIGSNPEVARPAGIPPGRRVFAAFCVSGAITDLLWVAHYGTIDSTADTGYELRVVSVVVVGGARLRRQRHHGRRRARHLPVLGRGDLGVLLLLLLFLAIALDQAISAPFTSGRRLRRTSRA